MIANGVVSYRPGRQSIPAHNSAEAEYIAANETSNTIIELDQLYKETAIVADQPMLFLDSVPAMCQIKTNQSLKSTKHIEIKYHHLRKRSKNKILYLKHINTQENTDDLFTKPLNGPRMIKLNNKLVIVMLASLTTLLWVSLTAVPLCQSARLFERVNPILWFKKYNYVKILVE